MFSLFQLEGLFETKRRRKGDSPPAKQNLEIKLEEPAAVIDMKPEEDIKPVNYLNVEEIKRVNILQFCQHDSMFSQFCSY